jgi:hypothetical protein
MGNGGCAASGIAQDIGILAGFAWRTAGARRSLKSTGRQWIGALLSIRFTLNLSGESAR